MKVLIAFATVLLVHACSTNQHEVKTLDTKLESKGKVGDHKIGLNDKNEAIMQEEVSAQDELRIQESVNMAFEEDLRREAGELKRCRRDMAEPRLGGSGELATIPEVDNMKEVEEVKEEVGLTEEGDLKVVRKSYYLDRLKAARKYDVTMRKMLKVIKRHNEECELKLGIARTKAGLPAERTAAEGYYTEKGVWVETRKGEKSIGDAYEIQADNRERAKTQNASD